MKITEQQKQILDGLVCQRLTADQKNWKLMRTFRCSRGAGLLNYLLEKGWREDEEGTTAFYFIKNQKGEALMFFSLKCGALFDPLDEAELQRRIDAYREILDLIRTARNSTERNAALELLERIRVNPGVTLDQLERKLRFSISRKKNTLWEIHGDRMHEPNDKIVRVGETYPGIELVHFCVNDSARKFWQSTGIKQPMGKVLFWWFIAPILYGVQDILGCQYVFLFAADYSQDRNLINYYQVDLNFEQPADIGTSKPRYDFECEFMCQKISALRDYRKYYLDHFNPDPNEPFV